MEHNLTQLTPCPRIAGLREIADKYDALLCDVWGVLHNGISAAPGAIEALSEFKKMGKATFLLTNAPRPNQQVLRQLAKLNVPLETTFDQVVTSGDVTRGVISKLNKPLFHIGTMFDKSLFKDLDVKLVDLQSAGAVICTGLYDDYIESPDDYTHLLNEIRAGNLPFICANPDLVVEHGGKMRWCAGALANKYQEIGGETIIIGKPNRPVYEHAHKMLNQVAENELCKSRILAIGDGIGTDIAGALGYGLDVVYISAGIHSTQYGDADNPDEEKLQVFLKTHNSAPVAWIPRLQW